VLAPPKKQKKRKQAEAEAKEPATEPEAPAAKKQKPTRESDADYCKRYAAWAAPPGSTSPARRACCACAHRQPCAHALWSAVLSQSHLARPARAHQRTGGLAVQGLYPAPRAGGAASTAEL